MKKIIALMITSFLLTSCFGGTEKAEDEAKTKTPDEINNVEIKKETNNTEVDNVVEWNNEDEEEEVNDNDKIIDVNDENAKIKVSITDDDTNEKQPAWDVSDEEALETEVNDLLDEFIDSLDSYDK